MKAFVVKNPLISVISARVTFRKCVEQMARPMIMSVISNAGGVVDSPMDHVLVKKATNVIVLMWSFQCVELMK